MAYAHYQTQNQLAHGRAVVTTTDDYSTVTLPLIPANAGRTVYIQKIVFTVTEEDASTVQVEDGEGVILANWTNPTEPETRTIDFGPAGFPCEPGGGLFFRNSAVGMGLTVYFEGYEALSEGGLVP